MNALQIFSYEGKEVRTIQKDGEPWFVAADVCNILEISNTSDAMSRIDEDEKGLDSTDTLGGRQFLVIVNESGLYSLILGSRKTEAKRFKRWVTHEVLPSIRKHGLYAVDEVLANPDLLIRALQDLKVERAKRAGLEEKVEQQKPKVLFADAVETSKTSILVGDLAKLIKQNGYDIGQKRLFEWLRQNDYLIKAGNSKNMPTQKSMDLGLFEVRERTVSNPDGSVMVVKTTKVTGKGQIYFINKFVKERALVNA